MVFLCRVQWVNIGDGTRGNFDIFEAAFPAFQLALMEDGMPVFVCLFNKKLDGQIRQWILGAWFLGMFQMIQMGLGRWTKKNNPGPLIILESTCRAEVALRFLSRPSPIDPMAKPSIFTSAVLKVLQNRGVAKVLVRCGACTQLNPGEHRGFHWDSAGFFQHFPTKWGHHGDIANDEHEISRTWFW